MQVGEGCGTARNPGLGDGTARPRRKSALQLIEEASLTRHPRLPHRRRLANHFRRDRDQICRIIQPLGLLGVTHLPPPGPAPRAPGMQMLGQPLQDVACLCISDSAGSAWGGRTSCGSGRFLESLGATVVPREHDGRPLPHRSGEHDPRQASARWLIPLPSPASWTRGAGAASMGCSSAWTRSDRGGRNRAASCPARRRRARRIDEVFELGRVTAQPDRLNLPPEPVVPRREVMPPPSCA